MRKLITIWAVVTMILAVSGAANAELFQDGGDRLTALQNTDGGWDWPLNNGNPATGSAGNILSPIGMGLAQAYLQTHDADHLAALQKAGGNLLTKTNSFTANDGAFAKQLDDIFGGNTYTSYVKTNFYNKLANGTYVTPDQTYSTQTFINRYLTSLPGYAGWDLGLALASAKAVGVDTTLWVQGTKAALNALNDGSSGYYALDLAGGIYGLAQAGETSFTGSGVFAGVDGLSGLAAKLKALQLENGAFQSATSDDTPDMQTTAYSILALSAFDHADNLAGIQTAGSYLQSNQLITGGWGDGENNHLTGDALWASGAVPEPATIALLGLGGLLLRKHKA